MIIYLCGMGSMLSAEAWQRACTILGVDDFMIQQILRQADVEATRRHYIKALPAQTIAAMAKLEAGLPELCAGRDASSKQASGLVV